ncbi:LysR family transcriptional regulator [Catenovulum sp. SM1970]|uniref:hydrogen peroxide-inducible genes activator n=1 Tax=Marinifaba aquimaris TaxID=2741323 RepID=UPI001572A280|nr:hydrogen peroxide-inducible genes activator [Marinifaba aquimaris]NTS75983.1 LysR family transcriptional regulator [Marinifaba aquimaris]
MKKLPSIRNLQYLIRLYEYQNFNKAAKACFVSQSTLSTGIQNLEEQLDKQLIERDNKSFIFTAFGEQVVNQAKDIVQRVAELADRNLAGQEMVGQLRVGCIPTIAPFIIKYLYQDIQKIYPDFEPELKEDTTDNLLKLLDAGELDCLILALPVEIGNFKTRLIGKDKFWLVAHQQFLDLNLAKNSQSFKSFEQLPNQSIYLLEKEHCMTQHAISACQLVNSEKINPLAATSLQTLVQLANCQLGATFIPQIAIDTGLLKGTELVAIEPTKLAFREIGLVWRGTTQRSATFVKFADTMASLFD